MHNHASMTSDGVAERGYEESFPLYKYTKRTGDLLHKQEWRLDEGRHGPIRPAVSEGKGGQAN